MTGLKLITRIGPGHRILCQLETSGPEKTDNPVICFSLLDEAQVVSGGEMIESLGGFCAVRLKGVLKQEAPLAFELAYLHMAPDRVINRAWLPLSPYIRKENGETDAVAAGPVGVSSTCSKELPALPLPEKMLPLVPVPKEWHPSGGICHFSGLSLMPDAAFPQAAMAVNALAKRNEMAELLADAGPRLSLTHDTALAADAHEISISETAIEVHAGSSESAFHAMISLLVLRTNTNGKLPCGVLRDSPRFGWRGQHIDCARHYYKGETLLRLLDFMALLKLNVFHWHFADDEAFRLEVESYPELWRKSAFRGEGQLLPGLFGGGAGPTGGSYSLDFTRRLIARAKELQIDVLPEMEFPGHNLAVTRVFPQLRDSMDTGKEKSIQSYPCNAINPALAQTWDFAFRLSAEITSIFPFAHLHIGGDEVAPGTWGHSPAVTQLKQTRGDLKTMEDVQGYAMERLAAKLQETGIRPCAWEEAAKGSTGGISNNALLFSWTSQGPGLEAARRGHDVIMCPGQHAYLDMAHTDNTDDWGASWAGITPLSATVAWDPVPSDEPELADRIKGIEATFWSEFTLEDRQIEPMLAPRIFGIACKAWSAPDAVDENRIHVLAAAQAPLLDAIGWQWNRVAIKA